MRILHKMLPVSLLAASSSTHAALLEVEVSGPLKHGYQQYGDLLGLGTTDLTEITGMQATFRWLIDTTLLGNNIGNGSTHSEWFDCADAVCGDNPFVHTTAIINGLTFLPSQNNSSIILIEENTGAPDFREVVFLYGGGEEHLAVVNGVLERHTELRLHVENFAPLASILEGVGIAQLDGWRTSVNGWASFSWREFLFASNGPGGRVAQIAAVFEFDQVNLRWSDGYEARDEPSTDVPAPTPLMLLLLAGVVVRRMKPLRSAALG